MTYESTYFLVTLADMKIYLGIDSTDVADDTMIGNILACVTYWMERETKRQLKARALTEYYDGNGKNKMLLKQWPINDTVATISVYDDTTLTFAAASKFASTDIVIYADEGIIGLLYDTFDVGLQNVKVIYNPGYGGTVFTTTPYDLILATYELMGFMWNRRAKHAWDVTGVSLATGGVQILDASAPRTVRETCEYYRRRPGA